MEKEREKIFSARLAQEFDPESNAVTVLSFSEKQVAVVVEGVCVVRSVGALAQIRLMSNDHSSAAIDVALKSTAIDFKGHDQ